MILKLKRTPGIYLVGFMASGKTTVGKRLADALGWEFADTDEDIEASEKLTIADIFDTRGEDEFRRLETEAIRKRVRAIQSGHPAVVALGGGAFSQPENFELIQENGVSVWLDCPLPVLLRRVEHSSNRPLARDRKKFELLFHQRRASYERADFHITISSDDPQAAVDAVLGLPIF